MVLISIAYTVLAMFSKLKLSHKVYLIVAIPLAFELAFVGVLYSMLKDAENEAQKAIKSRVVISKVNNLYMNIFESAFHARVTKTRLSGTHELTLRIKDNLSELEDLTRDNKEDYEFVVKLREQMTEIVLTALTAKKIQSRMDTMDDSSELIPKLNKIQNMLNTMRDQYIRMEKRGLKSVDRRRANIMNVLIFGSVFNVLIALFLVAVFNRSILRRLNHLMDNAYRLSKRESLTPPIPGGDEIAHLDQVFSDAGSELVVTSARQNAIFQDVADVICSLDRDGNFKQVSPNSLRAWGYEPDELIDTSLFNLVVASELSQAKDTFYKLSSDERTEFESSIRTKEGPIISILWSIRWSKAEEEFFCVAHDITNRKKHEALLIETESRLRNIIESLPVGLVITNLKGIIKQVNPTAEAMFRVEKDSVFDSSISRLIKVPGDGDATRLVQKALDKPMELTAQRSDRSTFPIEISVSEIESFEGKSYLILVLDVTERHEVERMKQQFIAMVSHELKTPLSSVQIYFEILERGTYGALNEKGTVALHKVANNVSRLSSLVEDLLVAERLESGSLELNVEKINLQDVFDLAMESIRAKMQEKSIAVEIDETDIELNADLNRLVQVLVNLLANAIKFSPEGSTIKVEQEREGKYLTISVSDEGRGIARESLEAVFDKYKQVSESDAIEHGGAGLGLAICKQIVELHGGTIDVESEVGKGSRFWFRLLV